MTIVSACAVSVLLLFGLVLQHGMTCTAHDTLIVDSCPLSLLAINLTLTGLGDSVLYPLQNTRRYKRLDSLHF